MIWGSHYFRKHPNHPGGFLNTNIWDMGYPPGNYITYFPPFGTFESMIFRFSLLVGYVTPPTTNIAPEHGWLEDACCLLGNPIFRGGFRWFQGGYSSLEGIILHEIWCDVVRSLGSRLVGRRAGPSAMSQFFLEPATF